MSVNVSAHQCMSSGFAATVERVLESTGTDGRLVTLEVTESVFVRDEERARVVLGELKAIGVPVAVWAPGYSPIT